MDNEKYTDKTNEQGKAGVDPLVILTSRFMYSDHYHCKTCYAPVEFITRIKWNPTTGVRSIGFCNECELMLIECEKGNRIRWYEFKI